jgi:hypothetical protein
LAVVVREQQTQLLVMLLEQEQMVQIQYFLQ